MRMRLDRYLHEAGAGSRREVNLLIRARRVTVGGAVATDGGASVPAGARVEVDGKETAPSDLKIVIFHKPRGFVTATRDAQRTIYDILPFRPDQLLPVGRLDKESEGLLILTSDGQLLYRLTNPKWHVEKEYEIELQHSIDDAAVARLREPLDLGKGEFSRPAIAAERIGDRIVRIVIAEGKYHQVRRMAAAVGHFVTKLTRTRVGPVGLGDLPAGEWRKITDTEERELYGAVAARRDILKKEKILDREAARKK